MLGYGQIRRCCDGRCEEGKGVGVGDEEQRSGRWILYSKYS